MGTHTGSSWVDGKQCLLRICVDRRSEGVSTKAVEKKKPEKIQAWAGIKPMTSAIPVQHSNQLSYQANWELVSREFVFIPYMENKWTWVYEIHIILFELYPQFKYMNFIYSCSMFAQLKTFITCFAFLWKAEWRGDNLRSIAFINVSWNNLVIISERMKQMTACFAGEKEKTIKFSSKARCIVQDWKCEKIKV